MQHHDGGQAQVDRDAAPGGFLDEVEDEEDALDVRRHGAVEGARDRRGVEFPAGLVDDPDVGHGRVQRHPVPGMGRGVKVVTLAHRGIVAVVRSGVKVAGVREVGPGVERGDASDPADLLVEPMVVPEGPPGRPAQVAFRGLAVEDGRGLQEAAVDRRPHLEVGVTVLGPGGGRRRPAAELRLGELGVGQLERQGEVAPQASVGGVGEHAGRRGGDIMEQATRGGRIGGEAGEQREVSRRGRGEGLRLIGDALTALEQADPRGGGAAEGGSRLPVGRGQRRPRFLEVDAGFHAFVADPVGEAAETTLRAVGFRFDEV